MTNYEVPFKNAKKDHDGYATILVKFGGWYVPVKGRPLPLVKDELDEETDLSEIKRINLTRWNLKDIPEIARLVANLKRKNAKLVNGKTVDNFLEKEEKTSN